VDRNLMMFRRRRGLCGEVDRGLERARVARLDRRRREQLFGVGLRFDDETVRKSGWTEDQVRALIGAGAARVESPDADGPAMGHASPTADDDIPF